MEAYISINPCSLSCDLSQLSQLLEVLHMFESCTLPATVSPLATTSTFVASFSASVVGVDTVSSSGMASLRRAFTSSAWGGSN